MLLNETLEKLLIKDMLVMDQLEGLRHQLDELTLTAKSRAKSADMLGYVLLFSIPFYPFSLLIITVTCRYVQNCI